MVMMLLDVETKYRVNTNNHYSQLGTVLCFVVYRPQFQSVFQCHKLQSDHDTPEKQIDATKKGHHRILTTGDFKKLHMR